jgi:predicted esterase
MNLSSESKRNIQNYSSKAVYYSHGDASKAKRLWLVCHGYGQLASRFIKKFTHLDPNDNFVVAPEGLSHFYLEGLSGNVGASWMTKHERALEIENQSAFLEALTSQLLTINRFEQVTLLGFSQGGATISRWAANSTIDFDDIYLWATVFPPDMSIDFLENKLKDKRIKLFYGDKDPFIKDSHLMRNEELIKIIPQMEIIPFEGDHRVIPKVLSANLD